MVVVGEGRMGGELVVAGEERLDGLTQRNCRARQSIAKPVVPLGKTAVSRAMLPFRTRV